MSVEHLEILVEEPSAEAALAMLIPKMAPSLSFALHPHQGKADLLTKLPAKLRAYARYMQPTWRVVIVIDRDRDDCVELKRRLETISSDAGVVTRSSAPNGRWVVVNRLAIEELEAWYFGDWAAVSAAYPRVPVTVSSQAKYRRSDEIRGGTCEALERILQKAGYFAGGLRKIELARAVSTRMVPSINVSPSFCALRDVIEGLGRS